MSNFEDKYRNSINQGTDVPDDIWGNISEQLDVDEVWDNVRSDLDRRDRIRFIGKVVIGVAALFLAIFGGIGLFGKLNSDQTQGLSDAVTPSTNSIPLSEKESNLNSNQSVQTPNITETSNPSANTNGSKKNISSDIRDQASSQGNSQDDVIIRADEFSSSSASPTSLALNRTISDSGIKLNDSEVLETENTKDEKNKGLLIPVIAQGKPILINGVASGLNSFQSKLNFNGKKIDYINARQLFFNLSPAKIVPEGGDENSHDEEHNDEDSNKEPNKPTAFLIKSVGLSASVRNHWLLNHDTYNGFKSSEIGTTKLTLGTSAGAEIGFSLKKTDFLFQLNGISQRGGAYQDYIKGKLVDRAIKLNYVNANFLIKPFRFDSKNSNVMVGLYSGILTKSTLQVGDGKIELNNTYRKIDYGLVAGKEYILPINDQLNIASGITFTYGLSNIFAGTSDIPSSFDNTRNLSVDGTISIRYLLK